MNKLELLKLEYMDIQREIDKIKLTYNYDNGFKNDDDFNKFLNENKSILENANQLRDQIRELEWELMTPEQQARAKEVAYLVKLKTGQIKEDGEEIQQ